MPIDISKLKVNTMSNINVEDNDEINENPNTPKETKTPE